jgi:hypothetical protein
VSWMNGRERNRKRKGEERLFGGRGRGAGIELHERVDEVLHVMHECVERLFGAVHVACIRVLAILQLLARGGLILYNEFKLIFKKGRGGK